MANHIHRVNSTHSSPMSKRLYVQSTTNLGGKTFPDDVMIEILPRIPAEELKEMKLVNREWRSTISSKYFTRSKHLERMKEQNRVSFLLQSHLGFYPLGYEPPLEGDEGNRRANLTGDPPFYALASCSGFIFFVNLKDRFFVVNPMLAESWEISSPKIIFPERATFATTFYGMGLVPGTDEFKIVRVVLFNTCEFRTEVLCYSTVTNVWSYVSEFPIDYPVWCPGVYASGSLHWQICSVNTIESIVSFNCTDHTFLVICLQQGRGRLTSYGELGCVDDDKLVIYSSIAHSFAECEMWTLEDFSDDTSWKRTLLGPGYVPFPNEFILAIKPLRLLNPCGRRLLIRIESSGRYAEYDFVDGFYYDVEGPNWNLECVTVFPFVQSLIRLN